MKKLLAVLLTLCLMASLIPTAALAANKTQKISLEEAVKIAKGHFQPSQEYDQFDSSYEQSDFANVWSLRWYSSKGQGEINVRIDAETGEVAGYNHYNPKDYEGTFSSIPKFTKKEGEKIALDFINKFAPSKAKQVVLKPTNQRYYGGPIFHNYTFYRVIDGVEYPGNNINIEINGHTGEVRSFYSQWENLSITPVKAKLTQKDAQDKFNEDFGMDLRYFKPQASNRAQSKAVKLVYEIINPYQVTIDALTGEVILDDYYYPYFRESEMAMDMGGAGSSEKVLEPFEQEVVDEIKGLISKEDALKIAKKVIAIPSHFILRHSELRSDWELPELKIWAFNWNYEDKNHYGWASVEIDAKTGKVLSFSCNEHKYDGQGKDLLQPDTMVINTRAEAEKIVQDFIKANYPEAINNIQLRKDHQYELLIKYGKEAEAPDLDKGQAYYYFNYERLVNGIPYGQNYINATVNSYTGKISDFRIRFIDTTFPTTEKVITQEQFVADFFKENPMQLVYTKDKDRNLRLVYKLAPLASYRFDAVTGDMLNWAGEVIKDPKTEELSGIAGHPAENDIRLLNELGLLYVKDGIYTPDSQLTQAELIKMLVKSKNSYVNDSTSGNWYDAYYEQAKNSGLISEKEVDPLGIVTREEMAKFLVRTLVWDKIATLDIYQVPEFDDADQISKGYEGYVTIINSLELMSQEDNTFKPKTQFKKGEACTLMVEYLRIEKQRIN